MQFGPGTTVTVSITSPQEQPVTGVVQPDGSLVIDGEVYAYHAGPPEDYRRQDPGNPPGDWHTLVFDAAGDVNRYLYPKETMNRIHTGAGSWTAVA